VELRSLAERKRGEREKIIWREGKNYFLTINKFLFKWGGGVSPPPHLAKPAKETFS